MMQVIGQNKNIVMLIAGSFVIGVILLAVGNQRGSGTGLHPSSQSQPSLTTEDDIIKTKVQAELMSQLKSIQVKAGHTVFPPVKTLRQDQQLRILVTGGAGFVGSHLVDVLMMQGHIVYVMDNLFTGRKKNVQHWIGHPNFQFFHHDVTEEFLVEVDQIYHLACPASPPHYQYNPIKTIKTSTHGTMNMLGLAKRVRARLLLASTSEVYGDPEQHPQKESYRGNVNTMGPRACYDEGKRVAETMCYTYREEHGVEVRVARIFNTFGPRMHPNDGRVVSNFIIQALSNKPVTVYGSGSQTRSFQYVSDLVRGLYLLMNSNYQEPVNLGNPDEYTINDFATKIKGMIHSEVEIKHLPASKDDPQQRKPDISTAKREINWQPTFPVNKGLENTIVYFRRELGIEGEKVDQPPIWMPTDLVPLVTKDEVDSSSSEL